MKVGDKVILKEFKSNDDLMWSNRFYDFVDKEVKVGEVDNEDGTFFVSENSHWWLQSACEPVKEGSQEYFYVGQIVYSALFDNKDRKAIVTSTTNGDTYPIVCEGDGVFLGFTLDGKRRFSDNFISLFQEPIQFPVNKPIEIFEGDICKAHFGETGIIMESDGCFWLFFLEEPSKSPLYDFKEHNKPNTTLSICGLRSFNNLS